MHIVRVAFVGLVAAAAAVIFVRRALIASSTSWRVVKVRHVFLSIKLVANLRWVFSGTINKKIKDKSETSEKRIYVIHSSSNRIK